jgi:hypothetical protein
MHPVERYVRELRDNRVAGVPETSNYGALQRLLDSAGTSLRPRVRCVLHPQAGEDGGLPDAGLFTTDQFPSGADELPAFLPSRGVVEAKPLSSDVRRIARTQQVTRYLGTYGQVLVTSFRDWVLVERGDDGGPVASERFRMAETEAEFWERASDPRALAENLGDRLIEYLQRVMLRPAPLVDPQDVARLLAAYARDALYRVERNGQLPALASVRQSLEEALGVSFHGEQGDRFFRSSLVQTLFYGVFSAWTIWSREGSGGRFRWREAVWHLRVPVIGALYSQIATPDRLAPLGLVEVLDWAENGLNRIVPAEFFRRFNESHAVQYFYEPFLQAFDPQLRQELGVWYTPPEVVEYMVGRVDHVLRTNLGIADGLADPNVVVLDPCCGTGAYLVAVLERIGRHLLDTGEASLSGMQLHEAAASRVFGLELLPAPFVVAHLQIALLLRRYGIDYTQHPSGAPGTTRRVGVYLTNALTRWQEEGGRRRIGFPELEEERNAADHVKREERILVVLGNPPYNGYPGLAMGEESDLVAAYKTATRAPQPQGQGLNDLYVRFFRMAERRIVEITGCGVVCFISNYSWLDGLSYTGMRERYLDNFDRIWIDSLNGDKYRTGKLTPEGEPDPSVFSTEWNREGIQVGTAISLLVRRPDHTSSGGVRFRNLWGVNKRQELLESLTDNRLDDRYQWIEPASELGLPFVPAETSATYLSWTLLPQLFPTSCPGVKTSRDSFLVSIDREALVQRVHRYFDASVSDEELRREEPDSMESTSGFDASKTRQYLLSQGFASGQIMRYCYRPFDLRWLYWHPETRLLDRNRAEYVQHVADGNLWIEARQRQTTDFDRGYVTQHLADNFGNGLSSYFPMRTSVGLFAASSEHRENISTAAREYLETIGASADELFFHALAVLHSPAYRAENSGALRQDWPRIPLPSDGTHLKASASLGKLIAALLNPEVAVNGVTAGTRRAELRVLAMPTKRDGSALAGEDLALTAGWGYAGAAGATMPGRGVVELRAYTDSERATMEQGFSTHGLDPSLAFSLIGEKCLDVYLNEEAFWRCVPERVWEYSLSGYKVVKKWLSYREEPILGRPLSLAEVQEVTAMVRRIGAILLETPGLDGAYTGIKVATRALQD